MPKYIPAIWTTATIRIRLSKKTKKDDLGII
jgi:hypothetical protein